MAGPFDAFAGTLSQTLVRVFVPGGKDWVRRATENYDPTSGSDPVVTTTANFRTGVPAPYTVKPVNGTTVLTDDLQIFVAKLDIDQANGGAGFDPFPGNNVEVLVVINGIEHKVISHTNFTSGDDQFGYMFQIRK